MLAPMRLVEQWKEIEGGLQQGWPEATLSVTLAEDGDADRAALILASFAPGRTGPSFRFDVRPDRSPERILARLDQEGFRGLVDLVGTTVRAVKTAPAEATPSRVAPLARQWDELVADLPPDWSEVYAEIELFSSDFVSRAALLTAPLNPANFGATTALRFRSASQTGYGTAAQMVRRCLERLDAEGITGTVRALRVLSHTSHAFTQGPVWRVGSRSV
jgi:hypothetical protein